MRDQREFLLHCAVADLLRLSAHPDTIFHHPANGEVCSAITGARLKRMGVRPGTPDFALVLPGGRAAFIELKAGKGKQSKAQRLFQEHCGRNGALYGVVRSFEDAQFILSVWGALKQRPPPAVQGELGDWEPIGDAARRVVSRLCEEGVSVGEAVEQGRGK